MDIEIEKTDKTLNYMNDRKAPVAKEGAQPLPKMTIDGQVVEFYPGDTIMMAAERANIAADIPRFCYHPGLPVAGTCRMCTVEVEKAPKLMTSCSAPAADGMVVHTQSDKVRKSRTGVMEFLLTNHPLDCPVCDKAGECELQNYNYEYGPGTSRFKEEKRVWEESTTKALSDKVTLNMNRCVHCERCVRFTEDVTKTYDLVMLNRGWKKELAAADERGLFNDYQGCLTDFCPVGALTYNDFRFQKRVWFLKKNPSVCDQCSKGCNIEVHHEKNNIYRYMPQYNEKVNGHWMCDEGRESYHMGMNPERIISTMLPYQGEMHAADKQMTLDLVKTELKFLNNSQKILVIIGTDATQEEATRLKESMPSLTAAKADFYFFNGTNGVKESQEDAKLDDILRMKDKTPNTRGMEKLALKPLPQQLSMEEYALVLYFRNGRAALPHDHLLKAKKVILWGVFNYSETKAVKNLTALIPGVTTQEKAGTFINCDQVVQHFSAAINPQGDSMLVDEVLAHFVK